MQVGVIFACSWGPGWNDQNRMQQLRRSQDSIFIVGIQSHPIHVSNAPVYMDNHQVFIVTRWNSHSFNLYVFSEFPSGLSPSQRYYKRTASVECYMRTFVQYARMIFIRKLARRSMSLNVGDCMDITAFTEFKRICVDAAVRAMSNVDENDLMRCAVNKLDKFKRSTLVKLCMRAREGFVAIWRNDASTHLCWLPRDILRIIAALCIDAVAQI